jgi:hypothetical protein
MWKVYLLMFVVVAVVSFLMVNGITNMHENHPDYKGDDLFGFDDDDINESLWNKDREKDYDED